MHPGRFLSLLAIDEAERASQRDEAFREWHRQPDALPIVETAKTATPATSARRSTVSRGFGVTRLVGRLFSRRSTRAAEASDQT
jgi:hypothetical protein